MVDRVPATEGHSDVRAVGVASASAIGFLPVDAVGSASASHPGVEESLKVRTVNAPISIHIGGALCRLPCCHEHFHIRPIDSTVQIEIRGTRNGDADRRRG